MPMLGQHTIPHTKDKFKHYFGCIFTVDFNINVDFANSVTGLNSVAACYLN